MTSKARTLAGTVSTGAVLADGTVAATEVTGLPTFPTGTVVGATDSQTLTNKTIAFADNTLTGVVGLTATQTLTNKTLTNPTITDGTVDGSAIGFRGIPSAGAAKTSSYTLTTTDRGDFVEVGSGGSITVPTSTFAAGDAVVIFNNTTGNITLTTSAPTTYVGGTNTIRTSVTLAARGICNVLFVTPTLCIITGNVT